MEVHGVFHPNKIETDRFEPYWKFLQKFGYKPKYGYRYPVKVVTGITCGFVLIYDVINLVLWKWLPDVERFLFQSINYAELADFITDTIQRAGYCETDEDGSGVKDIFRVVCQNSILDDYILMIAQSFYYTFFVALGISTFIACMSMILQLAAYRRHSRLCRKGMIADIPIDKKDHYSVIVSGFKYGAYIIAYPCWALLFQTVTLWLILFLIGWAGGSMHLLGVDNCIWGKYLAECFPSWFYTVFMIAFQMFLARAFFAIDGKIYKVRRKYDRSGPQGSVMLTNRRLFDIFSLFFWFNNMFIGLFSLLFRMFWAIICGLPMLGRLDQAMSVW